jgi:NitT/TauT family transport system substrate-binding protein
VAERVRLRLQWVPQAQFAGYIVAKELRYYADAKLDVEVRPAGPDLKPQMTVAAGTDDIAVGVSNQVITARSNGVPLKIIAQIFQDSANRYVLRRQNAIRSLRELRGKKVGLWLGGDEAEFVAMLKTADMELRDVTVVPQGFTITPFLQDAYVLSQVTVYNELVQLRDQGLTDDNLQILSPRDYQAAIVGDMLFTTESYLTQHRTTAQRFLEQSIRGWVYCLANPESSVDLVMRYDPSLKRADQVKQMKEVLALIRAGQARTEGVGFMNPEDYSTAMRVLLTSSQISRPIDVGSVFDASLWKDIPPAEKAVPPTN